MEIHTLKPKAKNLTHEEMTDGCKGSTLGEAVCRYALKVKQVLA
jgi:hypothetical protein